MWDGGNLEWDLGQHNCCGMENKPTVVGLRTTQMLCDRELPNCHGIENQLLWDREPNCCGIENNPTVVG